MTKLKREMILSEALAFIDEQGEKALSMRALAARMDVSAMSLYTYFPSREELVNAALGLMRAEYDEGPIPGEFWEDTVRRTASSLREVALRHPKAYRASRDYVDGSRIHMRRVFQLHRDQGIPLDAYHRLFSMMDAYLGGFIANEIDQRAANFAPVDENDPDHDWLVVAQESYDDFTFAGGISLIIRGMHLYDPEGAATWRTPEDPSVWTWR